MSLKISCFSALYLFLCISGVTAQDTNKPAGPLTPEAIHRLHEAEDTLAILAYAVVNDSIEQERFAACRSLITKLVRSLKTENSYHYPFERLKSISILAPPDSSFRIFTWQLFVNDSTYRYYGAIQMNRAKLQLFPLVDRSIDVGEEPNLTTLEISPDQWYGMLYYALRPFETRDGPKYLLFGYDAYTFFQKRKVIDVLSFGKDGKPVFGAPVFYPESDTTKRKVDGEYRLLFEYLSGAGVRVNWDEQYQMVLFDHLIPMPNPYGPGMAYVPDGSYDGLKFEKGRWKYIEKVFKDVMSEAPRPEPILDNRTGKDVMGKAKRPKGSRSKGN